MLEVLRVATDGAKHACSFLYGCCLRAARSLGFERCITYTLQSEPGASVKGAGFDGPFEVEDAERDWSRPSRPRHRQEVLFDLPQRERAPRWRWEAWLT